MEMDDEGGTRQAERETWRKVGGGALTARRRARTARGRSLAGRRDGAGQTLQLAK
jgi:hypothetical protein